jgi:hypothetical protein
VAGGGSIGGPTRSAPSFSGLYVERQDFAAGDNSIPIRQMADPRQPLHP